MPFEYVVVTVFNLMIYFLENYGSCYAVMYLFLAFFFILAFSRSYILHFAFTMEDLI